MPQDELVHFTDAQQLRGAKVGIKRRLNAIHQGFRSRHTGNYSRWVGDIEGASAELAGHLFTGLPWTGEHYYPKRAGLKPPPDLGTSTEVHWNDPRDGRPRLYLDPLDDPDRYFILVTGYTPEMHIRGFMHGREILEVGEEREMWRSGRNVLVVYAEHLHSVPVNAAVRKTTESTDTLQTAPLEERPPRSSLAIRSGGHDHRNWRFP